MNANQFQPAPGYLEVLLEASRALIQAASVQDALSKTVWLSEQILAADAYAVWQMDRETRRIKLLLSSGLSDNYIHTSEVTLPEDYELAELVVPDVQSEPLLDEVKWRYGTEGICSLLVLPLLVGNADFGTLTLYYKTRHEFTDQELLLARTLTNLSAAAISAALMLEAQVTSRQTLQQALENQRKVEARLRFLNRASMVLNESLDYKLTLANLTRIVVPEYADWCAVHLVEEGELRQVALAHADPDRLRLAEELQSRYPSDVDTARGPRRVVKTGSSEIVPEISPEFLHAIARDDEHRRLIEEAGFKSYVCVPIRTRTEVIGALTMIQAESGHNYEQDDLEIAEQVGWRAGLAVEKAALFEESQRARQDLERANQTKDEFLGLVSHELRTPITTIYGSARLLMRTPSRLDDATKEELIGAIGEEADKMVQLVESLLMLARLEVGQALQKVPVSIAEAIETCAEPLVSAGRKVEIDYENRVKEIDADRTYLQHILTNLLSNADKYSPPDAPIGLVVQENDTAVEFHVLDQGLGVEAGELDMIFDSFYRSPRTAQLPGKGLGLAICKRLTEAQGGRIWANLRPGGGMEVAFSLPK